MKKFLKILILGIGFMAFSQQPDLNRQTLNLYYKKDWKKLIIITEKAQALGQTSFKTDFRLAEAYYYSGNYHDSAKAFEEIIKKYQTKNDTVLEYLYYSYLFSGRQLDALLIADIFPFHLQKQTGVRKSEFIDVINAEGGVKLSDQKA
jgi:tetratricopeptide (TPR) repeat protein